MSDFSDLVLRGVKHTIPLSVFAKNNAYDSTLGLQVHHMVSIRSRVPNVPSVQIGNDRFIVF